LGTVKRTSKPSSAPSRQSETVSLGRAQSLAMRSSGHQGSCLHRMGPRPDCRRRNRRTVEVTRILVGSPIRTADGPGCWIAYRALRDGLTALLLVVLSAGGLAWQSHAEAFRRLIPDTRGVGASRAPSGPYKTAQMADDCARALEAPDCPRVRSGRAWCGLARQRGGQERVLEL
jgi:hypothetical protein